MTTGEPFQLGTFRLEDFTRHDTKQEHATKGGAWLLREFAGALRSVGRTPSFDDIDKASQKYMGEGNGYYFCSTGYDRDTKGEQTGKTSLVNGVTTAYDPETKTCHVEDIFNNESDARVYDSMYYLWLRRVIRNSSLTKHLGEEAGATPRIMALTGVETNSIHFVQIPDRPTERLLETFGMQDHSGWHIPTPRLTIVGNEGMIRDLMEQVPPPDDRTVALVAAGKRLTTHYFDLGKKLGTLTRGNEEELGILCDAQGEELDMVIPDYGDSYDMAESFGDLAAAAQLGLVALKRALSAS